MLRAGGNAVDGVLAAAFTSFIAEPIMSQPYGGGFLMVQQRGERHAHLLDFYGHTPKMKTSQEALDNRVVEADFGQTKQKFHIGAGTIAASGLALGFAEALAQFGTMTLPQLAAQAICLAREGIVLDQKQADIFQVVAAVLQSDKDAMALYGNDKGALLQKGELWRNEALGDVLEVWAQEGARFMSEGEAARALLEITEQGGAVRAEDLRDYQVKAREPLAIKYKGVDIFANPPPSAGGVLIKLALSLLEETQPIDVASALTKLYHAREALGHLSDPSKGEALLAPEVLAELRARPKFWRGTTHISAIDERGLGASLSITNGAGSGLIAKGTGIHLNDMLGEPELMPQTANGDEALAFPPDVRLCSMMSPMMVSAREHFISMGGAGSTRIPSALVQTLLPLLDGKSCEEAVAAPRMHYEERLSFEDFFNQSQKESLLTAYPDAEVWQERAMFFGGVNVARLSDGELDAAADPRRAGLGLVGSSRKVE